MMIKTLREQVYEANMLLPRHGLVTFTWGNVSGIDRQQGLFVIKPSGVPYEELTPEKLVVVDLDGQKAEGELNPSSDTPTHVEIYRGFAQAGGVVHTHSRWATIWAQAGRDIPAYGTTHADTFYGSIPCVPALSRAQVERAYERETGLAIVSYFEEKGLNPQFVPGALLYTHGPFAWGADALEALHNAVVLEEVAMMAWHTEALPCASPRPDMPDYIKDKHFLRKHGPNAYYGQR